MLFVSALIICNALVFEWEYTSTVWYETRNGVATLFYIEAKKQNILIFRLVRFFGLLNLFKVLITSQPFENRSLFGVIGPFNA